MRTLQLQCSQYVLFSTTLHIAIVYGLTTVNLGGMAEYNFFEFAYRCRKIVGAGLNYKRIIKQRNLEAPKNPVIFLKPSSSLMTPMEQTIVIKGDSEVHHEVELGIIISQHCKNKDKYDALNCIAGYCLALDLTDMKQLKKAREQGLPWTIGKGFDNACPVSDFIPEHEISDPDDVPMWLKVNGELRQKSSTSDMLFKTGELISYISKHMTLEPYDLVLTGTPAGTGPLKNGDTIEAGLGKGDMVYVKYHVQTE